MTELIALSSGVEAALADNQPVVALESTLITHGLPFPENLSCARDAQDQIRAQGPTPATIAVIDGQIRIGLEETELERISQDGKWVRFRIEGWIWGPSLKGFEIEEEADENVEQAPKMPLQDNLPRGKRLINESYGLFYGIGLDADLESLVVRF